MARHLHPIDLAIVALYLLGITLFGLRFREKKGAPKSDRSLKSYFLANNTIPWWAIALSIVSAETSTLTIISIPGVAFAGDFGFLQIVLGYMLGRIVVAALFLPRYFAGEMLTAYQLIDRRFGHTLHKVTAGLFLLTRAAAEGVRIFAVSIVVGIAIGTGDTLSIAIISLLTLLYTFEGGMAAVIWTDVVQMAIYIGGTFVAVWSLGHHVPGGWATIHSVGATAGKFHLFDFALNLTTTYTFWAGILGGTFLTMASHGTDQLMVQRMLAARSLRESRLALLSSGVVIFMQFALFLLIGVGLYVFYGPPLEARTATGVWYWSAHILPAGIAPDRLFPTFIVHELPLGIAGLLVAAILAAAMSNLSAALNSLSSSTVIDFYIALRPQADDRERALVSRSSTVLWAIVLFVIALYSLSVGGKGHVVEIGLSIASVAYGCLLGVFLLGTLTKFATQTGATIGMICGFALNLWLWQAAFPKTLFRLTIPHIAFTWYVLIGAIVTFAIGTLFSLIFRKQSKRTITRTATVALLLFFLSFPKGICVSAAAQTQRDPHRPTHLQPLGPAPNFTPITTLLNDAIAAHKLPGAVVLIGHHNKIVFEKAYGNRKLAGEPGIDGKPSPAEPMTEDTLFDMASLTKDLATATAIMQLYEAGKITCFDDPVEKYLPAFNEAHDPTRRKVTLRMMLTHTSGEAPDISLKDPWGLAKPDKAEGIHRALTTPLVAAPGSIFTYSDINFILLGDIVETLSGQPEDVYTREHIFLPLGMTDTQYLPLDKACGPHKVIGAAIVWAPFGPGVSRMVCPKSTWGTGLLERIAPTTHDDEGNAQTNPHFNLLTRGTVHDPTTRRMGGVAGHAGVFSTAHDISLYAAALLEKLLHNTGPFPLKQPTLELMTLPQEPGVGDDKKQLADADDANAKAIARGDKPAEPGLAPHYPAIKNQNLRGFGWDIDTAFSKPRGVVFPIGSFGHTGFTGTSLWMDPASDTYVILLANAIHPRGNPPISNLRGQVATAAAKALGLDHPNSVILSEGAGPHPAPQSKDPDTASSTPTGQTLSTQTSSAPSDETLRRQAVKAVKSELKGSYSTDKNGCDWACPTTLTGIDVLESTHFSALTSLHHIGLLANQASLDAHGHRTIDILLANHQPLTTLFTPEHGLSGTQDTTRQLAETDPATHLPIISLYGAHDADRRPTHAQLANLDAVLIDLQDAGVRFWTYEAASLYFLEAAAREQYQFHHDLQIIVLDRPNPVGGVAVQGPISDPGTESYASSMLIPVRHGLTLGELLRYANAEVVLPFIAPPQPTGPTGIHNMHTPPRMVGEDGIERHLDGTPVQGIGAHLTVVPMQHWSRSQFFADTGLPWVNPSPNLRSPEANLRYPALGLIEFTNISVGRGTDHPFSFFGAGIPPTKPSTSTATGGLADAGSPTTMGNRGSSSAWFKATKVANYLTARNIPGVTFTLTAETIAEDANHYPFHGQTLQAVRITLTDPKQTDTPELGIEILAALHHLYPTQFNLPRAMPLVCNQATMEALTRGDDPRAIAATWQASLNRFRQQRNAYLLYQ